VAVRYTAAAQVLRNAFGLRSLTDWYGLEIAEAFAVIRAGVGGNGATEVVRYEHWNPSIGALYGSGPAYELSITQPLEQQLAMLRQYQPRYLMSYPSNLQGLLEQSPANPCGLAFVIALGETLAPEEVGPIAAQCERGGFHCMAEGVVLEVVDDAGASCAPGEIGRVLVTDLRNFATALIRYDLRDYAEVGPPCKCGRGLPTLNRIIGRERNLLRLPDGRRFWPMLGLRSDEARRLVRQFQVLQVAPERLHLKIWPQRPLTPSDLRWLLNTLQHATGYPFALDIETLDGPLPRGANGKFQEFQNLLPD
jgi:phenylacetate-CoA ligase